MNLIGNFVSDTICRLFNMTTPCEITNEFFYLCGHTVTTRRCRNNLRRGNRYYLPEDACSAECRTRTLPTMTHMHMRCLWCGISPNTPVTNSARSDPDLDRIPAPELQRRREAHRSAYQQRMPEAAQSRLTYMASRQGQWEALRRREHESQDRQGLGWRERTYYVGGGVDHRLMRPVRAREMPDSGDGDCNICMGTLREGTPIVLPCHEKHRLHSDCLERWLLESDLTNSCPYCRESFELVKFEEWCEAFSDYAGFFSDPLPGRLPTDQEEDNF